MGGEGSILAMIISMKNNRALLRSKRMRKPGRSVRHHSSEPIVYENKMTADQFVHFKKELRKERIFRDVVRISILVFALAVTATLLILAFRAILII